MNRKTSFARIKMNDNNEYICPLEYVQNNRYLSEDLPDDCVEAEVVGRYIGHLNMSDNT